MVKSLEQAERIQKSHRAAGKAGVSKAVRRFMRRAGAEWNCGLAYNKHKS